MQKDFSLPDPHISLLIPVSVNLNSDPDKVEDILVDEASKPWRLFPDCSGIRHPSFDSFPVSGNSHSISRSFAALQITWTSI